MTNPRRPSHGLADFWIDADREARPDHPLELELCHRLCAVERYLGMIAEAQALGRDEMAEDLIAQHERESRLVRQLQEALHKPQQRTS